MHQNFLRLDLFKGNGMFILCVIEDSEHEFNMFMVE